MNCPEKRTSERRPWLFSDKQEMLHVAFPQQEGWCSRSRSSRTFQPSCLCGAKDGQLIALLHYKTGSWMPSGTQKWKPCQWVLETHHTKPIVQFLLSPLATRLKELLSQLIIFQFPISLSTSLSYSASKTHLYSGLYLFLLTRTLFLSETSVTADWNEASGTQYLWHRWDKLGLWFSRRSGDWNTTSNNHLVFYFQF